MVNGLYKVPSADISQRTKWYAFVRLFFLLAIAVPGLITLFIFQGWSVDVLRNFILLLIALASNGIFALLIRIFPKNYQQQIFASLWIALDILLVTFVIYTNGGIESRSPILYAMPILMAAAIYGRRATYIAALSSSLLYIILIVSDYFGIIHSVGAMDPTLRSNLPYVVNSISFFPSIMIVIALAVDLITRQLIEKQQQARESLEALIRAQDIAKLGSWEWDVKKNKLIWSDALVKIFGLSGPPENFDYDMYRGLLHPDDAKAHHRVISTALKKKVPFTVNHRIIAADGTLKHIHGEGRPLLGSSGEVVKLMGTAQDVTELYRLDEAKGEFVSLASHQLRTPASGVKAFLSLLLDDYAGVLSNKQREFIARAYDANNRQLDIIDDLLSLAAIESGKLKLHPQVLDLNELVKGCVPDIIPEIKSHKQKLTTKYAKKTVEVLVDPSRIRMVLDNLLSNAIKYTPDKGRITVNIYQSKASAYIEVTDTGIGMSRDNLPYLFQKFHRLSDATSTSVTGSGLGLYIAKYIMRLHKGEITVRSQPCKGSTFKVRLPLYRATSTRP